MQVNGAEIRSLDELFKSIDRNISDAVQAAAGKAAAVTVRSLSEVITEQALQEKLLKYLLRADSFPSISSVNREYSGVSSNIRNTYLEETSLIEFLRTNNITNYQTIKTEIYDLLMSNRNNQLIPHKYIKKDLYANLLNEGPPYKIFSTGSAFCAVLDNGSLHTWGDPRFGGQQPNLPAESQVKSVFSTNFAFCAVLDDGTFHTWGDLNTGGQQLPLLNNERIATW